jgi:hypothetical protein
VKYISPSADVSAQTVPDYDATPSVVLESTGTTNLQHKSIATGKTLESWDLVALSTVTAGVSMGIRKTNYYTDGTNDTLEIGYSDDDPLMNQIAWYGGSGPITTSTAGSRYRINAKSLTFKLDASALNNQGMFYGGSIGNSVAPTGQATEGTPAISVSSWINRQIFPTTAQLTNVPGSLTINARDGIYGVHRNQGTFNYYSADPAVIDYQDLPVPGNVIGWSPCLDWDMLVFKAHNLSPLASVHVTTHTVYEIIPEVGSILTSLVKDPMVEPQALEILRRLHIEFGQFFPSDFNDWGTLWNGAKDFFANNKDLIGTMAGAIPVAGNALSAIIKAVPTNQQTTQMKQQSQPTRLNAEVAPNGKTVLQPEVSRANIASPMPSGRKGGVVVGRRKKRNPLSRR